MVAQFRASMAEHFGDNRWKCLVRKLRAESAEFDSLWDRHEVRWMEDLTERFNHPAGLLEFDFTNLWFGPRNETRLTTYTPSTQDIRDRVLAFGAILVS